MVSIKLIILNVINKVGDEMRFDKFGIIALIVGLILLAGVMHFHFSWEWVAAIIALIVGAILVVGILLVVIGILLLFL
jgi:hypothetical protein